MTLPFEMAGRLTRLDRSRRHLVHSGVDPYDLNIQVLLDGTAEFVLDLAGSGPACPIEDEWWPRVAFELVWEARAGIGSNGGRVLTRLERSINPEGSPGAHRTVQVAPRWPNHSPLQPELVASSLKRFFDWVETDGFREMHPVEKMTLCQIRLCEILPFQLCSVPLAMVFSWCFLLEQKYLVPSYAIDQRMAFDEALGQAFNFSTSELLAFNLDACQRSYPEDLISLA